MVGAKLSEGLNFADDLARAVIVVGLPFANLGSSELQERLKYVKQQGEKRDTTSGAGMTKKDAGAELYENMCLNAVNQCVGPCFFNFSYESRLVKFLSQAVQLGTRAIGHR